VERGAKLKPGGLCLAYPGQVHLPQVLAAMAKHLRYWWTFAIVYDQLILAGGGGRPRLFAGEVPGSNSETRSK